MENCLKPMEKKELDGSSLVNSINLYSVSGVITESLKTILDCLKTIQPTSTESERIFSLAGNIVSLRRHRLCDKSIDIICFLKSFFLNKELS